MDIVEHNRAAWNQEVRRGNRWTVPVGEAEIQAARSGDLSILLTATRAAPEEWLGPLPGKEVLCLASGGGQQGPLLAAAGARVTVFDNSDEQLAGDRRVADAFGLELRTLRGNMQDLSVFADASFDLIVHPVSNVFVDDVRPVWREAWRVLRPGGRLLSGFCNPLIYMIDWEDADRTGRAGLRHAIPYSDVESLSPERKRVYIEEGRPFEFGHSLTDQIGGQIDAGFLIAGFYEDKGEELLDRYRALYRHPGYQAVARRWVHRRATVCGRPRSHLPKVSVKSE
ncbi:MAG: class I SAM-dependent methyltransferase [Anaerolineae bacterium]|jgi:SAM-dependent methyltransferase